MKALFISPRWPHPLSEFSNGTALRMRAILRGMQIAGTRIDLLLYAPPGLALEPDLPQTIRDDLDRLWGVKVSKVFLVNRDLVDEHQKEWWRGYLRPIFGVRYQAQFAQLLGPVPAAALRDAMAECRPDFLFAHRLNSMVAVRRSGTKLPVVFDLDDVAHKTFRRLLEIPPAWLASHLRWGWLPTLEWCERRAVARAAATFVCSSLDRDYLARRFRSRSVHVLPNALPVPVRTPVPAEPVVLFVGMMTYLPNRQGVEHLLREIWPRVRALHPEARLWVAGIGAETVDGHAQPPAGVEFLGFVPDLHALYARSRVVVAPILTGGGTRVKIVEAVLYGRPVVSTTLGAEGLDLSTERGEVVIADEPEAFARAIEALLRDDVLAARIGEAGFVAGRTHYGEEVVHRIVGERIRALELSAQGSM
jgi:glycosyltransferase involved in cell wall biosynthesis